MELQLDGKRETLGIETMWSGRASETFPEEASGGLSEGGKARAHPSDQSEDGLVLAVILIALFYARSVPCVTCTHRNNYKVTSTEYFYDTDTIYFDTCYTEFYLPYRMVSIYETQQ